MKELLLTMAVVLGVVWVPCGIAGLAWAIKWAVRERRWWKAATEEAFDDIDEEATYV